MSKAVPLKTLADLRSRRWFADAGVRGFAHRQRMQQQGWRRSDMMDKPMIAIINTWSDMSPCHAHLRERAESVKKGILMAIEPTCQHSRGSSRAARQLGT